MSRSYVIVVSGAPRSGTSLMMQMLEAGGIAPLHDHARPPDAGNPRGYYELEAVRRLPEDAGWIREAPGRAVKVVHARVTRLPPGSDYRVLWMERDLLEVARSQRTFLERVGQAPEDGLTDARVAEIQGHQLRMAASAVDAREDSVRLSVSYARLFREAAHEIAQIDAFLGGGLDCGAMLRGIDPELHRTRRPSLNGGC